MSWMNLFWTMGRKSSRSAVQKARLSIEALEERAVPAASTYVLPVHPGVTTQALLTNVATADLAGGVLTVNGTPNGDSISVTQEGNTLLVSVNGQPVGQYDASLVDTPRIDGGQGNDRIMVAANVQEGAILTGGLGTDAIIGGGGRSILIGGAETDALHARSITNLLIGGNYTGTEADLTALLGVWAGPALYSQRAVDATLRLAGKVTGDGATDFVFGLGATDLSVVGVEDTDIRFPWEVAITL